MKLSAPIHELKSRAKALKQIKSLSLIAALDQVAIDEGYASWSLLQSKVKTYLPRSRGEILGYLNSGDMMLLGARPGLGKTTMALDLMLQASLEGREAYFFSLDFTEDEILARFARVQDGASKMRLNFDFSDEISSSYIVQKLTEKILPDSLVVVDYLQLLDQRRTKPELNNQIETLKHFAQECHCTIILLSQIDRNFNEENDVAPSVEDIRMPNYFDLTLFNKILLFNRDRLFFLKPHEFEVN